MRISVGPPYLTINHGSTFLVTDLDGEIDSNSLQGLFTDDTRFLSHYGCYIDGHSWIRLMSTATRYYAARISLINPELSSRSGKIPKGSLSLTISRTVEQGIHEDLDLTNNSLQAVSFNLEIELRSDFADLFEVQSGQVVRREQIETHWDRDNSELRTRYQNQDFYRCLVYQVRNCPTPAKYANGHITFAIQLQPGESWHACGYYTLSDNQHERQPVDLCYLEAIAPDVDTELQQRQRLWQDSATAMTTPNEDVKRLYRQSIEDMGAMRLYDYDLAPDVWIPAAGVPKYVALFGRDSLIASLQNAIVHPGFAEGTLKKLGELQAKEYDDWRDAEPGKILHELRQGELAYFNKIPRSPYYGAADTTSLYLIALHETWKWLGDKFKIADYREIAENCLNWIDQYGDLDGDGFQEFKARSEDGIENQCWKDSGDSIVYPDGTQVKAPKTVCELQGYAFDAWMRMAEVFQAWGDRDRATQLRHKAMKLHQQFEQKFWCEDIGFYAFTLDPDKQPVPTIASNPGHCLWSGIVSPERAEQVVKRLLEPDMWSGWGIRTLSAKNPAFNPHAYHLGSVWPNDNSLIALGFKRYGFAQEAAAIAHDIFEAANHFACYRIPEVYAGTQRHLGTFPVPYREANIPQAWAAGSVFQLLQAIAGLQADAPNHCLYVDPVLPEWLGELKLCNLEIGDAIVDLQFWREGDSRSDPYGNRTCWDAEVQQGEIEVRAKAWQPWASTTLASTF
ncbi:amylo-alpha-1,6-glucosidase [Desertifilum sp. FACHB-1129]|uniref:Amylo-alpha-1,6-glucosidase n=1 Tax=Desertifilum tharense IPPAS B-1220 TaxID=1781255 RepID=A0A1E5QNH7_9CYAN|nr:MULTISPECIES: glycogen debranching N-terminal domain-containing protein [Desertifilum]MDA0210322.1 amylo-alpha-1,6-glucosidase [Cyanobacteria bacterium FC1]MBD2310269.1 amylo-alpha-1,6-glucosidase [Desertifilum sp. FACHB-1129]MBD2322645.1 amylo-alpha-1,6-glucosidase [Desertifilum sp. FACHB-866]MBD2333523.1 amylo-alpha-1,6-glucosidase [Desertifilum sp. FACHB-868]OEJ76188.1 amylo-alpha-1,6-glucosidase [Desertifilum tharense IPPAS B-1220]